MIKEKILLVDDEENIIKLVAYNLEKEGFTTVSSKNGRDAWEKIKQDKPDLVILDVMLPGIDGITLLKRLRQENPALPVIMLTARGEEIDRIVGLELGCDDYVTKPFSPRELAARVKAVLRRSQGEVRLGQSKIVVDHLTVYPEQYEVTVEGEPVSLTPKEFELLVYLAQNRGRVLTRDILLDKVWGYDYSGDSRIVDVNISHLRDKIEKDPKKPEIIKTIRGVGYRIDSPRER